MATTDAPRAGHDSLVHNWKYVLTTTNPPRGRMDPVSKWLYLTRAGVLPMTLVVGLGGGSARDLPRRRRHVGMVRAVGARPRARAHVEQPHERPVRPRGRNRPRGVPAQPVLAAPGARRRGDAQAARDVRVDRQLPVPRDHDRADGRARLADRRVRARWLPALGRLHGAAAAAEEARARRADRARRVGAR